MDPRLKTPIFKEFFLAPYESVVFGLPPEKTIPHPPVLLQKQAQSWDETNPVHLSVRKHRNTERQSPMITLQDQQPSRLHREGVVMKEETLEWKTLRYAYVQRHKRKVFTFKRLAGRKVIVHLEGVNSAAIFRHKGVVVRVPIGQIGFGSVSACRAKGLALSAMGEVL